MKNHIENFTVRYTELGMDNRIRVQALCNYMEEAAGNHASALGVGLDHLKEDGLTWVLAKMRLLFTRFPVAGERLALETWPVAVERLQFRRDFVLRDAVGAQCMAAATQWVVLGLASRRIERMPGGFSHLVPDVPRYALEQGDIRIPALPSDMEADGVAIPSFPVRLADIDQNRHVNNVRYVDFTLEAAQAFFENVADQAVFENDETQEGGAFRALQEGGASRALRQIDLIFRAEGLRGDVICVGTQEEADTPGSLIHSIRRAADGQELARARTLWTYRAISDCPASKTR